MGDLPNAVRVAVRSLSRARGFTATAALTLGLGIGLATAVFTVADTLLIRRLPVRDQDRVVVLWGATGDGRFDRFPLLLDDARAFAATARTLEQVEFFAYGSPWQTPIRDGAQVHRLRRSPVSGGYFSALGVRPLIGRVLRPDIRGRHGRPARHCGDGEHPSRAVRSAGRSRGGVAGGRVSRSDQRRSLYRDASGVPIDGPA